MNRMMVRRREVLTFAAAGTVGAAHAQAPAAAWAPTRPVRLVTPYGAGNVADQVARILAEELSQRWSQRVVVDNQPGAGGVIGTSQVVRATADGTTLGFIAIAALAIVPHLMRQAPYDPLSDVVAIHGVSVSRSAIAVNSELPVRSLVDLATYARARPPGDPLAYYSAGTGTVPHLNLEQLRRELDFPAEHIPYRTSGAGLADLIAGRVQMTMDAGSVTLPHIQRGTLRGLAWNGPARNPLIPDVPTLAEAAPGLALMNAWQGIYGPASLPVEVTARIAQDVRAILAQPGFAGRMPGGAEPYLLGPAEMAAQLRDDHARLGRLVADIGLERS